MYVLNECILEMNLANGGDTNNCAAKYSNISKPAYMLNPFKECFSEAKDTD